MPKIHVHRIVTIEAECDCGWLMGTVGEGDAKIQLARHREEHRAQRQLRSE